MTAVVVGLSAAVALLGFLVFGLLRANAEMVRAMHRMGVNLGPDAPAATAAEPAAVALTPRPTPARPDVADLVDLAGVTPRGDAISLAVTTVRHDTLVAFLTSGCQSCRAFWETFRAGPLDVPGGARLVVVTRGPEAESPAVIAGLSGPAGSDGPVPVVMSTDVWEHYDVPYAPYFIYVSGPEGRVAGEGAAARWQEVRSLVANAVADGTTSPAPSSVGRPRSRADRQRDTAVDRQLEAAGIHPGDPRLYPSSIHDPASGS